MEESEIIQDKNGYGKFREALMWYTYVGISFWRIVVILPDISELEQL
jgi:hypothetical protein